MSLRYNLPDAGGADRKVTAGNGFSIEPSYIPESSSLVWSNGGLDPEGGDYPATEPADDEVLVEPGFLKGTDYRIFTSEQGAIQFMDGSGPLRAECFEPSAGRGRDPRRLREWPRLAFSVFLPANNDAYQPPDPAPPSEIKYEGPGPAVRAIAVSDDALNALSRTATITKVLKPAAYGFSTATDEEGNTTYTPLLTPDCSPTIYPPNPRFVAFVSLRGYAPGVAPAKPDPSTYYTSLWLWDTKEDTVQLILRVPDASILHPRFSPDGRFLAFTLTDMNFPPENYTPGQGAPIPNSPPDPVRAFDLFSASDSASALRKPFLSAVHVVPFEMSVDYDASQGGILVNSDHFAQVMVRATRFEAEGNASRDMMPFWSELNQLGFSSDRRDMDGNGYAEVVLPGGSATFDLYTFPHPFEIPAAEPLEEPVYEDPETPDRTPSRQTLGSAETDTTDEIHGDWRPLEPSPNRDGPFLGNMDARNVLGANPLALLAPRLAYSANAPVPPDNVANWDVWQGDRLAVTQFNGYVLNGLPAVEPKQGTPGEPVTITVNVNPQYVARDPEGSGAPVTRVFAIIKDPDNRLYSITNGLGMAPVSGDLATMIFREVNSDLVTIDAATYARYTETFGDIPDGPDVPQLGGLIELTESAAGSNQFTAQWFAPLEASDYLIDVVVAPPDAAAQVSDNIQGFTTAPFVPFSPILVVSDFAHGQQTVPYTTYTPSTAGVPTESYFTQRRHAEWSYSPEAPEDAMPTVAASGWTNLGPRIEFQSADVAEDPVTGRIVPDPDTALFTSQPLTGEGLGGPYDLWRTQCRPPITMDLLKNYAPYTVTQMGFPDTSTPRQQRVADRSVFWLAPHAGQVDGSAGLHAQGFGTIGNPATQLEIAAFLALGGRMLLAGDDVAFTLAQNVPGNPNPVLRAFKVNYESGKAPDVDGFDYQFQRTKSSASQANNQQGLNPVPYVAWEPSFLHFADPKPSQLALSPFFSYPRGTYLQDLQLPVAEDGTHEDGALTNLFIDSITAAKKGNDPRDYPGVPLFAFDDGKVSAVQTEAPLLTNGTAPTGVQENTSASKTLFFAFGLEGISREYAVNGGQVEVESPLPKLLHNIRDFLNTGAIAGTVYLNASTTPVNNVIVRAYDQYRANSVGFLKGTDVSGPSVGRPNRADGSYQIDGLDASIYTLDAYKTGYVFVNTAGSYLHGGEVRNRLNLYLIPVPPGKLTGTVTDLATGNPVGGAVVCIRDIGGTIDLEGVTAADGTYGFDIVQVGLYDVEVRAEGYDTFTSAGPVNVPQGPTVRVFDVALSPEIPPPPPAVVEGTVSDGSGSPMSGVQVTLLDRNGNVVPLVGDGLNPFTTAEDGRYRFVAAAGEYTVRAEATGFETQNVDVTTVSDETTTVDFTFSATPAPATVTGTVFDADDNPLLGATVTLTDANGDVVPTTDDGPNPATTEADGKYAFEVAAGSYTVAVTLDGYEPQTREANVAAGHTVTADFHLAAAVVPGTLQGRVTSTADGSGIPGATVHIRQTEGTVDLDRSTDSAGHYEFREIPPGDYTLEVGATGFVPFTGGDPVTVEPGPAATTQDVALEPLVVPPTPATLVVTVMNAVPTPARPLAGAAVSLLTADTNQPAATLDGGPNPLATATAGTGTFKVLPGAYTVRVEAPGYRPQTRTVVLAEDEAGVPPRSLTFTFGALVHRFASGRIVLASAPYDYTGTDLATVLGLPASSLMTSVVSFDAAHQGFLFYPNFPTDTFRLGRGYGMKLSTDASVRDVGIPGNTTPEGRFEVPLNIGWNLIGNPFPSAVPWEDGANGIRVRVATGGGFTTYSLSEAMSMGYFLSPLWGGYNEVNGVYNGAYQTAGALTPWEGRWLKVAQPMVLSIPKPSGAALSMGSTASAANHGGGLRSRADMWDVNITARVGNLVDNGLALGIGLRATTGYDAGLDLAKPSPMDAASPTLYTSFQPGWAGRPGAYATDVRGPGDPTTWTFRVNTNLRHQTVTLTWSAAGTLPAGTTASLLDTATGRRVDLSAGQYTYTTGRAVDNRAFRVEVRRVGKTRP